MANSFTGSVNTNSEWVTIDSVTVGVEGSEFTGFTAGSTYSIQMIGLGYLKISNAEFTIKTDYPFTFKMGQDDPYIKTNYTPVMLTILEQAEES